MRQFKPDSRAWVEWIGIVLLKCVLFGDFASLRNRRCRAEERIRQETSFDDGTRLPCIVPTNCWPTADFRMVVDEDDTTKPMSNADHGTVLWAGHLIGRSSTATAASRAIVVFMASPLALIGHAVASSPSALREPLPDEQTVPSRSASLDFTASSSAVFSLSSAVLLSSAWTAAMFTPSIEMLLMPRLSLPFRWNAAWNSCATGPIYLMEGSAPL